MNQKTEASCGKGQNLQILSFNIDLGICSFDELLNRVLQQ